MTIFNVTDSKEYKDPDPGVYYGIFEKYEDGTSKDGNEYLKWFFKGDDGTVYTVITDSSNPTTGNKLGRVLCGLKGSPLAGPVNPSEYIGKRYALVYAPNRNGKSSMSTVSPCK